MHQNLMGFVYSTVTLYIVFLNLDVLSLHSASPKWSLSNPNDQKITLKYASCLNQSERINLPHPYQIPDVTDVTSGT